MRSIVDYEEAVGIVRQQVKNGTLGFVVRVVSPWNVVGLVSWIEDLRKSGDNRPGIVMLMPNTRVSKLLTAEDVPIRAAQANTTILTITHSTPAQERRRRIRRTLKLPYLLLPRFVTSRTRPRDLHMVAPGSSDIPLLTDLGMTMVFARYNVRFAILEEGAADTGLGYFEDVQGALATPNQWLRNRIRIGAARLWRGVRALCNRGFPCRKLYLFRRDPKTEEIVLYSELAEAWRGILDRSVTFNRPSSAASARYAILVTEPWSENNQMPAGLEQEVIRQIISVLDQLGFKILLKPHPREPKDKHRGIVESRGVGQVEMLDGSVAIETMYPSLTSEDIVVGMSSQALVTANVIFGLDSYSADSLVAGNPDTGAYYRLYSRHYLQQFAQYVKDFGELVRLAESRDTCSVGQPGTQRERS